MRRLVAAVAVAALLAGGCSNSIDSDPQGNGTCEQTTKRKVFGITYSTDRNVLNCEG